MPERCSLCERPKQAGSEFCSLHEVAQKALETAYPAWRESYGILTKAEYFDRLESLNETGAAVKDVIRHLREKGATN